MSTPRASVLVIDDDRATRDIARRALTFAGYAVAALDHADLAPTDVARLAPELLVLDLLFGRQPAGLALLVRLRAHPATARLPVLVFTASPETAQAARSQLRELRCSVLLKPFRVAELSAAVAAALDDAEPAAGHRGSVFGELGRNGSECSDDGDEQQGTLGLDLPVQRPRNDTPRAIWSA